MNRMKPVENLLRGDICHTKVFYLSSVN